MDKIDLDKIDRTIAEKVMGWKEYIGTIGAYWTRTNKSDLFMLVQDWHPTRNISQAFEVVEKVSKYGFAIHRASPESKWRCIIGVELYLDDASCQKTVKAEASTPELAISLAAVECVEGER